LVIIILEKYTKKVNLNIKPAVQHTAGLKNSLKLQVINKPSSVPQKRWWSFIWTVSYLTALATHPEG